MYTMECLVQGTAVLLLLVSSVCAVNNTTTLNFLLMVASGPSQDSSAVVSAVNQTLKEVSVNFSFQLKYNISDTQVSDYKACSR